MKHLLAAVTFAALLTTAPAGAQVAYGVSPSDNAGASTAAVGNWRDAVVIYASGNTGSAVIDNAIAPLSNGGGAASVGGMTFDLRDASAGAAGFAGGTNAVAPVPEPATWAMMMLGFAAVGGALRRRKKAMRYA